MSTKKTSTVPYRTEEIQTSQMAASGESEPPASKNTISTLYDAIFAVLKGVLEHAMKREPRPYYSLFESYTADLSFWGHVLGVSNGQLDKDLHYSHRLRDTVLTLLVSLGDLLSSGLVHVLPEEEDREALLESSRLIPLTEDARMKLKEPVEAASYTGESIERFFFGFQNILGCLNKLSSSFELPAEDEFDDGEASVV